MRFSAFNDSYPNQSSQEISDVQGKLVQLGYVLTVNGTFDGATLAAVYAFQTKYGLPIQAKIDAPFVTMLGMLGRPGVSPPPPSPVSTTTLIIGGAALGFLLWWFS